jgi:hypothetical protein
VLRCSLHNCLLVSCQQMLNECSAEVHHQRASFRPRCIRHFISNRTSFAKRQGAWQYRVAAARHSQPKHSHSRTKPKAQTQSITAAPHSQPNHSHSRTTPTPITAATANSQPPADAVADRAAAPVPPRRRAAACRNAGPFTVRGFPLKDSTGGKGACAARLAFALLRAYPEVPSRCRRRR